MNSSMRHRGFGGRTNEGRFPRDTNRPPPHKRGRMGRELPRGRRQRPTRSPSGGIDRRYRERRRSPSRSRSYGRRPDRRGLQRRSPSRSRSPEQRRGNIHRAGVKSKRHGGTARRRSRSRSRNRSGSRSHKRRRGNNKSLSTQDRKSMLWPHHQ